MKRNRKKTFKLSKGKRTRKQQKQDLQTAFENQVINEFKGFKDKSCNSRAMYKIAGIVKNKTIRTNESNSVNQPKSRFCVATKKKSRCDYKISKKHQIEQKPKEWIRLRQKDVDNAKVIMGTKYL